MIPEYADAPEMKRVLEALHMNPERQDILLSHVLSRNGVDAQALGRTGNGTDHFHYATTFGFQVPAFLSRDDVEHLLKKVAREARLYLRRWEINGTRESDGDCWHFGIVTFFGITPFGDVRQKFYDDPPRLNPTEKYALSVAARLKLRAEQENREYTARLHGLAG